MAKVDECLAAAGVDRGNLFPAVWTASCLKQDPELETICRGVPRSRR